MEKKHANENVWSPWEYFIGSWEGRGEGKSGVSKTERKYEYVLDKKFIAIANKSTFEPQQANPQGEIHENRDFISFDQFRNKFVLRQFHNEGFVNQYLLDGMPSDYLKMVFVTETIENIPADWKARLTIEILNKDEFVEKFELAGPGEDFGCYIKNYMQRK